MTLYMMQGSLLGAFIEDKFRAFDSFDAELVTKDMDYACRQEEFVALHKALRESKWVQVREEIEGREASGCR